MTTVGVENAFQEAAVAFAASSPTAATASPATAASAVDASALAAAFPCYRELAVGSAGAPDPASAATSGVAGLAEPEAFPAAAGISGPGRLLPYSAELVVDLVACHSGELLDEADRLEFLHYPLELDLLRDSAEVHIGRQPLGQAQCRYP